MARETFDLLGTYIHLRGEGAANRIEVTPKFWPEVTSGKRRELAEGRLVGVFPYDADWKSAEMHPTGDELVYLLSGAVDLVLQEPTGDRVIALEAGRGVLVPQGVWHTARVRKPGSALHVTPGAGTQHRGL